MTDERARAIEEKLDRVVELLQQLVALELSSRGANHAEIGKRIRVAKATVGMMLGGVKGEASK